MSSQLLKAQTGSMPLDVQEDGIERFEVDDLNPNWDMFAWRTLTQLFRKFERAAILLFGDGLILLGALFLLDKVFYGAGLLTRLNWRGDLALFSVVALFGQGAVGSYGPVERGGHARRVAFGVALSVLGLVFLRPVGNQFTVSLLFAALLLALLFGGFWAQRFVLGRLFAAWHQRGFAENNVLVVERPASQFAERFKLTAPGHIRIIRHTVNEPWKDARAEGGIEALPQVIAEHGVARVLVSSDLSSGQLRGLRKLCFANGASISILPTGEAAGWTAADLPNPLDWPAITPTVPWTRLLQIGFKRLLDLLGAAVGIVLLSPLFALTALAIRLESSGPVIFRQARPGLGGRPFTMYKFRSMRPDAEQLLRENAPLYQEWLANACKFPPGRDPRVSRLGRLLRTMSLDELPQLFNVLKGDMSLVGPRPIVGPEIEEYGADAARFLGVKPGITGWWQINGRSKVGYPERARLDLAYVNHWSLWLDLNKLALTLPRLLNGAH